MKRLFWIAPFVVLSVFYIFPFSAGASEVASTTEAESKFTIEIETTAANVADNEAPLGTDSFENTEPPEEPGEAVEKPAAPALSLSNSANGLTALWSDITGASYYIVYYKSAFNNGYSNLETGDTTCVIPETESGTLYFVKVQAVSAEGVRGYESAEKSLTYIAHAGNTEINFNGSSNVCVWNSVGGANKYQIAKKKSGDKAFTYFTTTSNTFTDKNVVKANTYYYQVRAVYATADNGTAYGAWSPVSSVVTLAQTNASLANKSNGIRAQWNAVNGAARYAVYYRSSDDTKWTTASTTNTFYPILNAKSGKLYYVQVRPVNGKVSGKYSKVKAITFLGRPAVTRSNASDGVNLSWKSVDGANKYQIAKKKNGASSYIYYYSTGTAFFDRDVYGNTAYYYQVRAVYETENSGTAYGEWSAVGTILRLVQPSVSLSNKSNGMRVEWSRVAGAVKYAVYIKAASASKWQSATTANNYYPMFTVKSGVLYYVQVRAIGSGAYGPFSKPKSLTFIGPANLNLSKPNSNPVLSWNKVPGANKYQIVKTKKGVSGYEYIYTTGTSYVDKAAAVSNGFYSYQIRAMYATEDKGTAYGAWSVAATTFRGTMIKQLQSQIGNSNTSYVKYINSKSGIGVTASFEWCAEFAWCMIDQFAAKVKIKDPVKPCIHVSEIAMQAKAKGALKSAYSSGYIPKPGDLFTTSFYKYPGSDGRLHIGFVESVETNANGQVTKVHTIEGNFNWENQSSINTRVSRNTWVPGKENAYSAILCEYIDLEKLFS